MENVPMKPMSPAQIITHTNATVCNHCMKPFTSSNSKVRHHCHLSGLYISATCNSCNLQLKLVKSRKLRHLVSDMTSNIRKTKPTSKLLDDFFIPIIAHNATNYDLHLLLKDLHNSDLYKQLGKDPEIKVIASNTEKYMCLQIGQLKLIDFYRFLAGSLSSLVNNIVKYDNTKLLNTRRHFPDDEQFNLLARKQLFCYEILPKN